MKLVQSIVKELDEKNILFSLEYYGQNDYGTYWDITYVLDNREYFQNKLVICKLQKIDSISEYLDFLFLRKLVLFQEMISEIKNDEDKQVIKEIYMLAKEKCDHIENGLVIQFINKNYEEIFAEEYHKYLLPHITLDLIAKFQGGINNVVFEYLAQNYNYLLINKFHAFQKTFEKNSKLFELLFHKKNLQEMQELGFNNILPIFALIWKGTNKQLKEIILPIVENIISDIENQIKNLDESDYRNVLILESQFRYVYKFIAEIKHPKANAFRKHNDWIESKLENELKEHGQKFSYELPIGKIINYIKNLQNWKLQMISLTHKNKEKVSGYISHLSSPPMESHDIIDIVSSNIPSDDYFTRSHQYYLGMVMSLGAATISSIWHDKELFPNSLQWYNEFLNFISEQVGGNINLSEDLESLYIMLQTVILSDEAINRDIVPLCYGAAMFICALTEKLLRTLYIYLMKDKLYVPLSSATLGTLLSPNNQEMVNIFGEDHLKNLSFFFCTVGDKKIGMNYRNALAHWIGLRDRDVNSMLVAKLFYLYTDVVNTIYLYFNKNPQKL